MPMLPAFAHWTLAEYGLVSASRTHAFRHNNVQADPFAVCRAFGSTLPICSETVEAVERNLKLFQKLPRTATISFLPALSVGLYPDDAAEALAITLPGRRFICLAVALVTSVGPFDGARAIRAMMQASMLRERLATYIPTTRQLADILKSLNARLRLTDFARLKAIWEVIFKQQVFPHLISRAEAGNTSSQATLGHLQNLMLKGLPPPETIAKIFGAFRKVARFNNPLIADVEIKVGAGAAWVLTFAQWCFGTIPTLSIYLDDKYILLNSLNSPVKVIITASSSNKSIDMVTCYPGKLQSDQLSPAMESDCYGMVLVECYGEWLLHEFGFADDLDRQLLCQLLQYAIPQILPKMTCGRFGRLGQNSILVDNYVASDPSEVNRGTALPEISKLGKICKMITKKPQKFTIREDAKRMIRHYLLVKRGIDKRKKRGQSADDYERGGDPTPESETCAMEELYKNVSTILVDIFALSLFEAPEAMLVRPIHDRHNDKQLRDAVCDVLRSGEPQTFDDGHLLQWARAMVGHIFDDNNRCLIVTSSRGQVVYPSVYGSGRIERVGYLRLSNFCGVLKYDGDVYNVVASPDNDVSDASDDQKQCIYESNQNPEILQPMNLYQNASVSWKTVEQENGEIQVNFLVHIGRKLTVMRNPSIFITALKDTLFCNCPHDSQSLLEEADRFTTNQPPWHEEVAENDENSLVNIIAVDGSEGLRRFALAHANGPVVLRGNACLRCCLDLCRRTAARRLIL